MAKGEHSALFDVIMRGRPLHGQSRTGLFRSISAWFRSRPKGGEAAPVYRTVPAQPTAAAGEPAPAATAPRRMICLDPHRREIRLQLSYASAIICVLALVTAIAGAFMAGEKAAPRWGLAIAPMSSDQRKKLPPQPYLADLSGLRRSASEATDAREPPEATAPATVQAKGAAGLVVQDRKRTVGLNYVIIQSYPEEKMATEAMDLLTKNGIECTVEKGLPGWKTAKTTWYSVVGVYGFSRVHSCPEYEAYVRKVKEIGEKLAGSKKSFKAFDPTPLKWGKQ
jgi:hypothetical protein